MSYWVWDDSLNIGIESIDIQHRQIVSFINDLYTGHLSRDKLVVSQVLIGLVSYANNHFTYEEELMATVKYPLEKEHKAAHVAFTKRVEEYLHAHEQGQDVARPLMSMLKVWLTQHINIEDRRYVPYFQKGLNKNWTDSLLLQLFGI